MHELANLVQIHHMQDWTQEVHQMVDYTQICIVLRLQQVDSLVDAHWAPPNGPLRVWQHRWCLPLATSGCTQLEQNSPTMLGQQCSVLSSVTGKAGSGQPVEHYSLSLIFWLVMIAIELGSVMFHLWSLWPWWAHTTLFNNFLHST